MCRGRRWRTALTLSPDPIAVLTLTSRPDVDIGEAGEELQSAAAMLRSDPAAGPAAELLAKVLRNIIASPTEPKFRHAPSRRNACRSALSHSKGT